MRCAALEPPDPSVSAARAKGDRKPFMREPVMQHARRTVDERGRAVDEGGLDRHRVVEEVLQAVGQFDFVAQLALEKSERGPAHRIERRQRRRIARTI